MKFICPLIIPTDECLERGDEAPIVWIWRWYGDYKVTPALEELAAKYYFEN